MATEKITVNLKEARQRLGHLVDAAARGEVVIITRRGKKVAVLTAVVDESRRPLPDLSDFRASIEVRGKPISETVLDERREARY